MAAQDKNRLRLQQRETNLVINPTATEGEKTKQQKPTT
jgi:hypothetical protein